MLDAIYTGLRYGVIIAFSVAGFWLTLMLFLGVLDVIAHIFRIDNGERKDERRPPNRREDPPS